MKGKWKDINGYENSYQVSNDGRIRSLPKEWYTRGYIVSTKERILKPKIDKRGKGYICVTLVNNLQKKTMLVHRLVAQAFIPNPENKPQINHIDGNTKNNNINNLEWCTASENQLHSVRILKNVPNNPTKGKFGIENKKSKKVFQLDLDYNLIRIWYGISEASRNLHINISCISECCNKKQKTAGGYIWRYDNEQF